LIAAGLVCALPAEARAFAGRPVAADSVVLVDPFLIAVTGMGADRARAGADRLITQGARLLVSWGTAAALAPGLRAGDLLLPPSVRCGSQDLAVDPVLRQHLLEKLPDGIRARQGTLLQSAEVVRNSVDKQRLLSQTGADAVDMESGAVALAAQTAGVPFLVVRAVVDAHDVTLPACVLDATDAFGRAHPRQLLLGIVKQPGVLIDLLKLGRAFRAALASLRAAAPVLRSSFAKA
jgi:adenosylhomocysteine nucleosidase